MIFSFCFTLAVLVVVLLVPKLISSRSNIVSHTLYKKISKLSICCDLYTYTYIHIYAHILTLNFEYLY